MSEKDTIDLEDKELVRLYELAFNVIPTVGDDGASKEFDAILKIIEKEAKKVVSSSKPALTKLLYTMAKSIDSKKQKYNTAYFSWIKFEAESEKIEVITEKLDVLENVLRYMIVKTEKDTNTQSEEVARMISGDTSDESEEDSKDVKKVKKEVKKEVKKDDSEEAKAKAKAVEAEQEEKEKKEKVDKAIDELVAEEK